MSQYGKEYHKFVMGEIRTDGWVSDWRLQQERRRTEEMGQRQFVKSPQIKDVRVYVPKNSTPRECTVCGSGIRQSNKTGRCGKHKIFIQPKPNQRAVCPYTGCPNLLNHKNTNGICKQHFFKFRARIRQQIVRACADPGCNALLNPKTRFDKCRAHAGAERQAVENARMRKVRERERELKKAA